MRLLNALSPGLIGILLLGAIMTRTLVQVIQEHQLRSNIRSRLDIELSAVDGAVVDEFSYRRRADKELEVVASVLTPRLIQPAEVAAMESRLVLDCGCPVRLVVRSLLSSDMDRQGRVYLSEEERKSEEQKQARRTLQERASALLSAELKEIRGARLAGLDLGAEGNGSVMMANVETPEIIQPFHVAFMQERLRAELGRTVTLRVNSILTQVAEAEGFVYGDQEQQPDPQQRMLLVQVESVLRDQLQELMPGSSILNCEVQAQSGRSDFVETDSEKTETLPFEVEASLRAPRILEASDVKKLEAALTTSLEHPVRLLVDSSVGATSSAEGLISP